jgi:hypothetical protein
MTPIRGKRLMPMAVGLLALVLVVACNEPPARAQIGDGRDGGVMWEAWARRSGSGGLCLEVRFIGRQAESICDVADDGTSTWQTDLGTGELLVVTTAEEGATSGILRLADGTVRPVDIAPAPEVTTMAIFVTLLEGGVGATGFVIQGADGSALELVPLD